MIIFFPTAEPFLALSYLALYSLLSTLSRDPEPNEPHPSKKLVHIVMKFIHFWVLLNLPRECPNFSLYLPKRNPGGIVEGGQRQDQSARTTRAGLVPPHHCHHPHPLSSCVLLPTCLPHLWLSVVCFVGEAWTRHPNTRPAPPEEDCELVLGLSRTGLTWA